MCCSFFGSLFPFHRFFRKSHNLLSTITLRSPLLPFSDPHPLSDDHIRFSKQDRLDSNERARRTGRRCLCYSSALVDFINKRMNIQLRKKPFRFRDTCCWFEWCYSSQEFCWISTVLLQILGRRRRPQRKRY